MFRILTTIISFLIIITSWATPIAEQPNFVAVEKQLTKNSNITGKFEQIRHIDGLENPLISSGTFKLSPDSGLYWDQDKPFKSVLKVTKDRLEQTVMDNPPTVITRDQQPVVFSFTQVFMSILQGNTDSIEQYFNASFKGDTKDWEITLTPKANLIGKAIKSIYLKGSNTITFVKVIDTEDNIVDIKFSDVVVK
ncbi:outer membrane lipoprotein carrier protein LolA [Francisella frigiditurris]|uniref:Outer membrane lipocarrier LolA family protein n=1 Tax=Francisella frigiditurris TaxID=1542390 RepID=A0A1J0KTE1_9GAMM|nr:outer membrane lipoprotein carrier protein LolA [Francisella frigiditurris]APC96918.1 outer membrane lipocarrier LolA family protein [Francisella frigiditurris]